MLRLQAHSQATLIGVFDGTFLPKSGNASYGVDSFFSIPGQEVSIFDVVGMESHRAFVVDETQTPPGLPRPSGCAAVDVCIEQIKDLYPQLAALGVTRWVGDRFSAKKKVIGAVTEQGGTLITLLSSDATRATSTPARRWVAPGARAATTGRSGGTTLTGRRRPWGAQG